MPRVYYNGLHWDSPVTADAQPQYTAGQQFSAALIPAGPVIHYNGINQFANDWSTQVAWVKTHGGRTGEIVLRLYWGYGNANYMGNDPGSTLGDAFYDGVVKTAVQQFQIRNFQVLNELNVEYEPYKSRQQLAGDMYNIAARIKSRAQADNIGPVYLGFPGPGNPIADAANPNSGWAQYWSDYTATITKSTAQGSAYNWLAVHSYPLTPNGSQGALFNLLGVQYGSLATRFPTLPQRYTEYGIHLSTYSGDFLARANGCKKVIQDFKTYVEGGTSGPDILSLFYWVAYHTPDEETPSNQSRNYQLVPNNSNLAPAQALASAF